jgi:hypothetical protein
MAVLAIGVPLGVHAQKVPLTSNMEASVGSYFTGEGVDAASRSGADSIERQILLRHKEAMLSSRSSDSLAAQNRLMNAATYAIGANQGYKRVTCSSFSCEIVVVLPKVDGGSEEASSVIGRLHNSLLAEKPSISILDPSMILEGSDSKNGFTILYYVSFS